MWEQTSQWLAFVGLSFDAVGFGVLAYDLLPEYQLQSRLKKLKVTRNHLDDVPNGTLGKPPFHTGDVPWSIVPGPARDKLIDQHSERLKTEGTRLLWYGCANTLNKISQEAYKRSETTVIFDTNAEFDSEEVNEKICQIELELGSQLERISFRTRPPVVVGIYLIVVGFILQMIATFPMWSV